MRLLSCISTIISSALQLALDSSLFYSQSPQVQSVKRGAGYAPPPQVGDISSQAQPAWRVSHRESPYAADCARLPARWLLYQQAAMNDV